MRAKDIIISMILSFFLSFIFGSIFAPSSFFGFIMFFFIIFFILLVIIRYRFYSKQLGEYKLASFALKTDFGKWKITDAYAIDAPSQLQTRPLNIRKFDKFTGEMLGNETININFKQIWDELLAKQINKMFPHDNDLKEMLNLRDDLEVKIVKGIITKFLTSVFTSGAEPRIHSIISQSNNLVMFWFGNNPPAEYGVYRTKEYFWKWKAVPWIVGLPVVDSFGTVLEDKIVVQDQDFSCLLVLPLYDEDYRKTRSLNLAKYGIIADSLATLAQKFNQVLPTLDWVDLLEAEKDRALTQKEVLRNGVMTAYSDVSTISTYAMDLLSAFSTISGMPSLPKEVREVLTPLVPKLKETQSITEKIEQKLKELAHAEEKPQKTEEQKLGEKIESKPAS